MKRSSFVSRIGQRCVAISPFCTGPTRFLAAFCFFILIGTSGAIADTVPYTIRAEFRLFQWCDLHACGCTVVTNWPGGYYTGGVKTNTQEACLGFLREYRNRHLCDGGNETSAPDKIFQPPDGFGCELGFVTESGTSRLATDNHTSAVCPPNSTASGSACACNPGYFASDNSCVPISPKNNGRCEPGKPQTPNPISIGTGNKFWHETDYIGGGPFPLEIARYYNAQASLSRNVMGSKWGIFPSLVIANSSNVQAIRHEGPVFNFVQQANGQWKVDNDVMERLVKLTSSWELKTAQDEVETYDANGRLLSIVNRHGWRKTFVYSDGTTGPNGGYVLDENGNATPMHLPPNLVIRVTDSAGRSLGYEYDASLRIVKITDPDGQAYLYRYAANNNLASVTYPDGRIRTYLYENATFKNALTGIGDENGGRYASYEYDAQGRATSSEHAGGVNRYSLVFNPDGSSAVTDPLGTTRTYGATSILGVVKATGESQPGGAGCGPASSVRTYDANGNIASTTDFNGNQTTYTYELARNLETSRTQAAGTALARTTTTGWHPTLRLRTKIAEPKRITTNTYDGSGNLLSKTVQASSDATGAQGFNAPVVGAARTWSYTYNQYGQVLTATGPHTDVADVTTYAYDARGNLTSVTNGANQVTMLSNYDAHGRVGQIVDPNGLGTTMVYSARGWLTSRTVGGETTGYEYDGVGQLKKVTQPDGSFITYTYDAAHRLTAIADSLGNRIDYTLDAMGNRLSEKVKDPAGVLVRQTTRVYDALNRLQQITGGAQ